MAIWTVDLTTEDGARGAAQNGGLACLIAGLLGIVGIIAFAAIGFRDIPVAMLGIGIGEILVFLIAAFRLRGGKGLIWGIVAAVLLVIEIASKAYLALAGTFAISALVGILIDTILLIVLVNGLRGAQALRSGTLGAGDAGEIFS